VANTRILSATKVNEARFGYNSLYNSIGQQLAGIENVDAEIRRPGDDIGQELMGDPHIALSNQLTSFGNATSSPFTINDKVLSGCRQLLLDRRQAFAAYGRRVPL